jgi:UDP-N-acetylglucosamine 2-epimerase
MATMRKIMTIVGTRPEIIKMSRVIPALEKQFRHVLVHTGQNFDYELNEIFFRDLGLRKPDHYLDAAGANAASTIAQVILKVDEVLEQEQPDAVLLYGDTNSCLSILAAKRRKIPVFHMEAGNRCFDQRVPEELNRKVVDHLSDVNMVLNEHARRYLLAEGLPAERIFKTGSHMREVLNHFRPQIDASDVLARLSLKAGDYFLVSAHREENVDSAKSLSGLLDSLNALAAKYRLPVIVSTHPRTRKRLEEHAGQAQALDTLVQFAKPFGFLDYIHLQMHARCVLSDSGTITEEASLLGLTAVTLRQAHERPEGMDVGTLVMCSMAKQKVLDAVTLVLEQVAGNMPRPLPVADYENPAVSTQVVRIVASYIDYVNRVVWHKDTEDGE